jgi:hypothetical protein
VSDKQQASPERDLASAQKTSMGSDQSEADFMDAGTLAAVSKADLDRGWIDINPPAVPQNFNPMPWAPDETKGFLGRPSGWER